MKNSAKSRALTIARIAFNERKKESIGARHMHDLPKRSRKADGGSVANKLLTDEDVGLGAPASPALLSDSDVGISPVSSGPLSNAPDEGWLSGAAKGAGTAVVKGLANSVGAVGNLGHFADYLLARGDSAITGRPVDDVLADYAKRRQATGLANRLDPSQVLPSGEDISAPILKRTGEYKPETETGKMAQSGIEAATSMIGPGGGSVALERGASSALANAGMRALGTTGKLAPVNIAAGAIGQGAMDATGDPLLGMAAGAALPAVGSSLASKAARTAGNVTRPFAEDLPVLGDRFAGQREQMTGERLLKEAQNPDALDRTLNPGPMRPGEDLNTDILPGSKPTLGQLSGDMGILQAERQARTADNTPFNMRDTDQNAARFGALREAAPDADAMRPSQMLQQHLDGIEQAGNAAVQRIQGGAQELASRLGPGASPEAIGATLRDTIESTRKEAAAARRALYAAVDPDGSLALVATPVRDAAGTISKGIDQYTAPLTADEARLIGRAKSLPDVIPFKSLLEMDKDISASMSAERRTAGQSPAWNRLQQLKGAVQGAINDAIDNQAAYQKGAVARGEMAPENTIAAKLKAETEAWLERRQTEARESLRTGTGEYTSPGSFFISNPSGAEISRNGRPGNASRDQSLQRDGELQPNFDEGATARLAAAKAGHAAYARLYKEGPVGQALKTMGFADNYAVPSSGLPARVIVRDDKGYQTASTFLKAAKNNPEAVNAMQDHALAPLRTSLNPDGTINSAKFNAWKKNYAGALRALDEVTPGFSGRFNSAARASDILAESGVKAKQQIADFQKSEAGKFLKLNDPIEVENRVGSMLTEGKSGPTQMRALLGKLKSDPTAIDGLRKAGIDWMVRKFSTTAEAGTSGEKIMSSAAFRKFVRDNGTTLSTLYPSEQVAMFRRIADDLDRANRSVTATAIKGSPGTAKDALPFMKRSLEEAKKHASLLSAAVAGSLLGFESAGLKGAAIGAGTGSAAYLMGSLRAAGIRKVDDMFRDALLNPDRARYYLSKVNPKEIERSGSAHALSRSLRRELMLAPVLERHQ